MEQEVVEIKPQEGFQEDVMSCEADIAIIGGAAGAGKTFALLLESLKHIEDPKFGSVYFRRTLKTIKAEGALWDESKNLFPLFDGKENESNLKWTFQSGANISFAGIEYEKDLSNWQGAQIPLIIFDELTEFTEKMFTFMFSRNRGLCSIKPYIRASCNPDPDSWVANFISWWIGEDGYPIKERCGQLRYCISYKGRFVWGDSKDEVIKKCPDAFSDSKFIASGINKEDLIKSVTFIPGDIYDNKKLLSQDPGYLGNLSALDEAEQARFLKGNWKVRNDGMGLYEDAAIDALFVNAEEFEETDPVLLGYNKQKPVYVSSNDYRNNFITCDAAKFGRDLCVIMVWKGFKVVHITVFHLSSEHEIHQEIELLRVEWQVPKVNVCVDQDGIGGGVCKLGRYYGFRARAEVAEDPDSRVKENFKMRKDQCAFRNANRVNQRRLKISLISVKIYDKGSTRPRWSRKLKWKGDMMDIEFLIKRQFRAIKRGETTLEGGVAKWEINSKEDQKLILDGDSPDLWDTIMMREDFELVRRRTKGVRYGS